MKVSFELNRKPVTAEGQAMARLLDVLREQFDLTGTKEGCGEGECGACTVMLDDRPVLSCLVPLLQCEGRSVVTVEGLAEKPEIQPFLERFVAEGASQCGACTPGIVVAGWALAAAKPALDRDEIRRALAGNLCRCTGYEAIFKTMEKGGAR